jgi:GntR family transcriptional regulator/MocR family aminotransferase
MPQSWANNGIDLHLDLAGTRVRGGLEAGLRDAVRSGRLTPGTRLPSSRDLAADLRIARNTVADAYGQLVAEGWLTAKTGSGTWVAERRLATPGRQPPKDRPAGQPRYDLRAGAPSSTAFDRRHWLAAARAALNAASDDVLGYPDPRGLAELRTALAGYLARARGVITNPENVVICSGFAHGLALVGRVLAEGGAKAVAIEAYGHETHRSLIAAQGLAPVPLPVDASGARPAESVLAEARAAVLTPAHQFPLGMTLAPRRRTAFVEWAARSGGLIVEDDYDGEFRYDRQPVGALQALAPEHVVYAGTASKSLAPGLRLGWLVTPAGLTDAVIAAKEGSGAHNSALDQLTLARLINSGGYDRQIRQARLTYRRRRDRLIGALNRLAPDVSLTGIAAGLHAVADLPPGYDEAAVVASAASHGVSVDGLSHYAADQSELRAAVVIGYGRPAEHAFSTAVSRLCAALADCAPVNRLLDE